MKNIWCNCARFKWYRLSLQQMAAAASKEDVGCNVGAIRQGCFFCGGARARLLLLVRKKRRQAGLLHSTVWPSSPGIHRHRSRPTVAAEIFRLQRSVHLRFRSGFIPVSRHHTISSRDQSGRKYIFKMKLSASSLALFAAAAAVAPGVSAFAPSAAASPRSAARMMELFATKKVFIDGEAGTTGLQVRDRLGKRTDIEIISPPSDLRKDEETRKKFINEADAVILCALDVVIRITCCFCVNPEDMPRSVWCLRFPQRA